MKRYVLKINDSTFVKDVSWIAGEIPSITTDSFENAAIFREEYLNHTVMNDSNGIGIPRKDLLLRYFPHLSVVKVKIVIDS